jgi:hypothetical protein
MPLARHPGAPSVCVLVVASLTLGCGGDTALTSTIVLDTADVGRIPLPEVVADVVDVLPRPGGGAWILNRVGPHIVVVDSTGSLEFAWGVRGDGPAEFGRPTSLLGAGAPGEVWTYDAAKGALIEVSQPSRPRSVRPTDPSVGDLVSLEMANTGMPSPRLFTVAGRFGLARYEGPLQATARLWASSLMAVDTTGSATVALDLTKVLVPPADAATRDFFIPHPLWDGCADGTLILYDPSADALRRFGADAAEIEAIGLPGRERPALTFERLARLVYQREIASTIGQAATDSATFVRAFEVEFERFRGRLSDVFPAYVDLRCAENGVWIQAFDPDEGRMGRGRRWLLALADGIRGVDMPEGFTPHRFARTAIWGSVYSPIGAPELGVIPMSALRDSR